MQPVSKEELLKLAKKRYENIIWYLKDKSVDTTRIKQKEIQTQEDEEKKYVEVNLGISI